MQIDANFVEKIKEISGQDIRVCYQCGMCSGVCPMSHLMDHPPRILMILLQRGVIKEALATRTFWLCASCLKCSCYCPRGVSPSQVMEAVRVILLKDANYRLKYDQLSTEILTTVPLQGLISASRKYF